LDDPYQALAEAHRVLKPDGCLYVSLYVYTPLQSALFRLVNAVARTFATEPWAFTVGRLKKAFARGGFELRRHLLEDVSWARGNLAGASWGTRARHFIKHSIMGFGTQLFMGVAMPRKTSRAETS